VCIGGLDRATYLNSSFKKCKLWVLGQRKGAYLSIWFASEMDKH